MTLTKAQRREAIWTGVRLGAYQAHALADPIAVAFLLYLGYVWLALIFVVGAAIGWAGWKRDFNLAWRPRPEHFRNVDAHDHHATF